MPWIKREADVHKCILPRVGETPDATTGDVWQCNVCKTKWKVNVKSDQRDSWFVWESTT